jgi:hypothetical protein
MTTSTAASAAGSTAPQSGLRNPVVARPVRLGAGALSVAGALFVLYPALRPFSDEASLQGAAAFASPAWLVAHVLAMVGFTLLPVGLLGLHQVLRGTARERLAFRAVILGIIGVGLTLPFYGAEAFGLNAIGQAALSAQDPALLELAVAVRSGVGLYLFLIGLLLVAVAAVVVAALAWKVEALPVWAGILFALGFGLFIPQFFFSQPVRVAHGLLVALGCWGLAAPLWRHSVARPESAEK